MFPLLVWGFDSLLNVLVLPVSAQRGMIAVDHVTGWLHLQSASPPALPIRSRWSAVLTISPTIRADLFTIARQPMTGFCHLGLAQLPAPPQQYPISHAIAVALNRGRTIRCHSADDDG